MKAIQEQNYYELLDITPAASQEEILQAYNRARATYGHNSPALYSLFNKEEAQELLRLIDEAYAVLSNQYKRKNYDQAKDLRYQNEAISSVTSATKTVEFATAQEAFVEELAIPTVDVTLQEAQAIPAFTPEDVSPQESSQGQGVAKTRFGSYQVDLQMESEIRGVEIYSGEILRKIRQYKNISLDQIVESTKITRTYLQAIENNDKKLLPAKVFTRGFVVQLAKALDLPEEKVVRTYLDQLYSGR